jgi:predicted acylesterase/phospholipase RssA
MGETAAGSRTAALVLGGAAVKGAFEAGALSVIAARGITVRRIVAASSGTLNATAFASGVRGRREEEAARNLVQLWEEDANLCDAIHPNLCAILKGKGISDQRKLLAMLRRHVRPCTRPDPAPIELQVVLAALHGRPGAIDGEPATTFSEIATFADADFDDAARLERLFLVATASAALPVLFTPVDVPGVGPCTDGGLVNNTPIVHALGDDPDEELGAILVVTATPSHFAAPPREYRGLQLLAHELDMVFAEWMYRDLRRAVQLREGLARLDALAARKRWSPGELDEIKAALGLDHARTVPIVSIRPVDALPGTMLSGFTDPAARRAYVEVGRTRAEQVLDGFGWR